MSAPAIHPAETVRYTIAIPLNNEEEHVVPLHARIVRIMSGRYEPFELIFVDDGSTDRTWNRLAELALLDRRVTAIKLRRNYGQTAALAAGFDHARGAIIITMDGDQQHDPGEIPLLIAKLEEGYDLVTGWRQVRSDNLVTRQWPSKVANWLMARLSGTELHDFGSTFKAYRREVLERIRLYGDLHRFIPALATSSGARIAEIPITISERDTGRSHYGLSRTIHVLFDLITIKFLLDYITRPLHFFGSIGLVSMLAAGLITGFLAVKKVFFGTHILDEHGPLTILGVVLFMAGVQLISTGLLGELMVRTYFESQGRRIYDVERVVGAR
ncbi:MAG: glycosyltransferase family 2 protein [Acidobacteria bacterium]|nr:glycosyltransferase family 2 protein [Acidobacteriota bacterium]